MGLNESYEHTRRHILMLKPIPTIEETFNIVTQDERQRSIRPVTAVDNVAFQAVVPLPTVLQASGVDEIAYAAAYNAGRTAQRPMCTHCGKAGHTIQKCFKLHGYPLAIEHMVLIRTRMCLSPRMCSLSRNIRIKAWFQLLLRWLMQLRMCVLIQIHATILYRQSLLI